MLPLLLCFKKSRTRVSFRCALVLERLVMRPTSVAFGGSVISAGFGSSIMLSRVPSVSLHGVAAVSVRRSAPRPKRALEIHYK